MAYVTYTTKALVCGTFKRNTSDSSYLLFTREAGMLYADARSVREEKSRQRYALQDFSLIKVSLIKGKRGWKIGSVNCLSNFYQEAEDKSARGSVVSIFRLLRRFLRGEEPAKELFDLSHSGLEILKKTIVEREFVESVIKLKILTNLGYVNSEKIPKAVNHNDLHTLASDFDPIIAREVTNIYAQAIDVSQL